MELSDNGIYIILFYILIVVAFISFLICIVSCCRMFNFCRGCFEMVAMCTGCMERDYLYYDDSYSCWDYDNHVYNQTRRMFGGCRVVHYDPENVSGSCCCVRKRTVCLNSSCTICLEDYNLGESVVLCPCGHCYHNKCIRSWLRIKNICPMCKVRVGYRSVSDERTPLLRNPPV